MSLPALDRKLFRETARLRGQVITIALVLASGIVCFISLRGTYASLAESQAEYYDRFRFAHLFAQAERVPEAVARRIEALPGVETLQTRVAADAMVPIEGMQRPAYGRLLSLPATRQPLTNALSLRQGRFPVAGSNDEVVVLEAFAVAHGLEPGQRLPVVIDGHLRSLRIVGVALSPEFVYAIRPGAMVDDPKRHAVLWMERNALSSALKLGGAFNDVTLRLSPGAADKPVLAALDRLLAPYGTNGANARKDQLSHRILSQELSQLKMLSTMVPAVFLGVAAFLVNLVLARLIRLQRGEIATLKAIGYPNARIARHYLGLVLVVMVPGAVVGAGGGYALGKIVLGLYAHSFRFPDLAFRPSVSLFAAAILISGLSALAGALGAVRAAVKLQPAVAMQPPAPARYRKTIIERLGLGALLGPTGMMIVREQLRRPFRTALSSLGVAGAVSLLILSHFAWDSLLAYFEGTFRREQRQDVAVVFAAPVSPRVVGELRHLPGVDAVEGLRAVPARVRHEHRARDSVIMGVPAAATLRRLVGKGGREVPLPRDGVVLTKTLGEVLDLRVGDRVTLELRDGERRAVKPVVAGFVDEAIGMQVYAQSETLAELESDLGAVSSALLKVDAREAEAIHARLRRSPRIIDVSEIRSDMQRLLDMNASIMDVWTLISILLAASVVFGVVYNNARIALAARGRDLASLRVLGFTRREISTILLGSQAIEVAVALPVGLLLGLLWARQFMSSVDQETFRWAVVIAPRTYLMSITVTVIAAAASALWVRRSLDSLDLVAVLKARE
jgi:putative ABC transport system permease protein